MSLLTEIKLNDKSGKFKTEVKGINEVGFAVPVPRTWDVDPLAKVTGEQEV